MDFSVAVQPGEAVGLVGESGCGKSTVALGVMQDLGVNGRIVGGSIKFKGRNLNEMSDEELRDIRGNEIAMIYQSADDPRGCDQGRGLCPRIRSGHRCETA